MNENRGRLVQTQKGEIGTTKNSDWKVIEQTGKIPVYLIQPGSNFPLTWKPKLNAEGKQEKKLCRAETLKVLGYID